jgi:hypothetical protein
VAADKFKNMSNGSNPANNGTTNFEITDEVVYSFGDLGKRLTWIYWIPKETIATLSNRFTISLLNNWGNDPEYDFYNDYYGSTWLTPTSWANYDADTFLDACIFGEGAVSRTPASNFRRKLVAT